MKKNLWVLALVAVLSFGLLALPGCSKSAEKPEPAPVEEPAAKGIDAPAELIAAANKYFESKPAPTIEAEDLHNAVLAKDDSYQIVDIRSADHYALGHIEGAINIPFKKTADEAEVAKLDDTKKIVVVCYTGHTASMTNMVWNMLGYNTLTLKFGMSGWTTDKAIVGIDVPGKAAGNYPTVTDAVEAQTFEAKEISAEYADAKAAILGQAQAFFAADIPPTIDAADVFNIVQSKDDGYQIISVRKGEDYEKGHIAGAINIPWTEIAKNVDKVDPSKKIIIYCYTGHTGGEAAMFLNLMGYETYNMKFGMSAWNNDPATGGNGGYDPAAVKGFPTVK